MYFGPQPYSSSAALFGPLHLVGEAPHHVCLCGLRTAVLHACCMVLSDIGAANQGMSAMESMVELAYLFYSQCCWQVP